MFQLKIGGIGKTNLYLHLCFFIFRKSANYCHFQIRVYLCVCQIASVLTQQAQNLQAFDVFGRN